MKRLERIYFHYPRNGRDFFLAFPNSGICSSEANNEQVWKNDIHREIRWKETHIYWSILVRKL